MDICDSIMCSCMCGNVVCVGMCGTIVCVAVCSCVITEYTFIYRNVLLCDNVVYVALWQQVCVGMCSCVAIWYMGCLKKNGSNM